MQSRDIKVCCFLFDPNVGGPHVRASAIYSRLKFKMYDPIIVLPNLPGNAYKYFVDHNISVVKLNITKPVSPKKVASLLRYLLRAPFSLKVIIDFLKHQNPDVVHVNGAADVLPAIAAKLCGIGLIWHLNDTAMPQSLAKIFGKLVVTMSSVVVVAAEAVGHYYAISSDKYTVLYAPVDTDKFSVRKLKQPPDSSSPITVGMIGNWNWIKGQDRFLEVLALMVKDGYDVRGVVVGGFPETQGNFWRPLLKQIKKSALKNRVSLRGFVANPEKELAKIDILLLTSRSEACPLSVLEGMSVGIPQVSFRVGGVPELLGDKGQNEAGIIVDEGDVMGMARSIKHLLKDADRFVQMQKNGRSRATLLFDIDLCVNKHDEIYYKLFTANN